VIYTQYHPGKYLVAWHPKSSTENERSTTVIETMEGNKVLVRQIAGAMARRICFYAKTGMKSTRGEELGFIKFGSRVDVFLPLEAKIHVNLGQDVKNRKDVLASL
jgi:phosphatidylserine decarboxylase